MIITNHRLNLNLYTERTTTASIQEKQIELPVLNNDTPAGSDAKPAEVLPFTAAVLDNSQKPSEPLTNEDSDVRLIRLLFEAMSGRKISLMQVPHETLDGQVSRNNFSAGLSFTQIKVEQSSANMNGDQPLAFERTTQISSQTIQSFQANLHIQLGDGSEVDLSHHSSLFESHDLSIQRQLVIDGEVVDPLVLTFNQSSATLSQAKVDFDLNVDGEIDSISYAAGPSAFLALDKNNNGKIDDGSELFGATSGDGFADLAQYDDNRDGVIDESDTVFSKLQLSSLDNQGNIKLENLADRNVGAIFLANLNTQSMLVDANNEVNGIVRKSGLFLQDDYTAGLVQHVDIVV
jgi:hypothetical protein